MLEASYLLGKKYNSSGTPRLSSLDRLSLEPQIFAEMAIRVSMKFFSSPGCHK